MQVSDVCKKARQQVGILYTESSTPLQTVHHSCLTYIRPHWEYAAPEWDPYQQELINSLERVQKPSRILY